MTAAPMAVVPVSPVAPAPRPSPSATPCGDKGGDDFARELGRARAPAKAAAANGARGNHNPKSVEANPPKSAAAARPAESERPDAEREPVAPTDEAKATGEPGAAPSGPAQVPAPPTGTVLPDAASKVAAAGFDVSESRGLRGGLAERDAALPALRLQRVATDPASVQAAHALAGRSPAADLPQAGADNEGARAVSTKAAAEGLSTALPLPPLALQTPASPAHHGASVQALPFEARLAAALDSAAFAPALASQVTWLVQEGVQQARLNLNPAEMGPVAVRIVLDGTQARIDFSADIAATRNALEASLPTLAAALHDSGLTLAGGGVFDGQARDGAPGARDPQQPTARGPSATAASTGEAPATVPASPLRSARGLVDLVA